MIEKYPYTDLSTMNLDWVILKVKEMIAAWAETRAEWTDTKAEFEELKLWISNYFTNLDVQTEINNKLDAMALDGTLSDIIAPHVAAGLPAVVADQIGAVVAAQISAVIAEQLPAVAAAQLPAIVATETAGQAAAWLEEHVDPDTGYVIDNSLTIAGAAADAKETGDRINEHFNFIMKYSTGQFADGEDITTGKYYAHGTTTETTGTNVAILNYQIPLAKGVTYYYKNLYAYFCTIVYDDGTTAALSDSSSPALQSDSITPNKNGLLYVSLGTTGGVLNTDISVYTTQDAPLDKPLGFFDTRVNILENMDVLKGRTALQLLNLNDVTLGKYYAHGKTTTSTTTTSCVMKYPIPVKKGFSYYFKDLYAYFCTVEYDDGTLAAFSDEASPNRVTGIFTPTKDGRVYITMPYKLNAQDMTCEFGCLGAIPISIKNSLFEIFAGNCIDLINTAYVTDNVRYRHTDSSYETDNSACVLNYVIPVIKDIKYYYQNIMAYNTIVCYLDGTIAALSDSDTPVIASGNFTATDDGYMFVSLSKNVNSHIYTSTDKPKARPVIEIYPDTNDILGVILNNNGSDFHFHSGSYDIIALYEEHYGSDYFENYAGYSSGAGAGIPVKNGTTMTFDAGAKFTAHYTGDNTNVIQYFAGFALESNVTIDGLDIYTQLIRNCIHDDFDNSSNGTTIIRNCTIHSDALIGIASGLGIHDKLIIENCNFIRDYAGYNLYVHNNGNAAAESFVVIKDCYFSGGIKIQYYGSSTAQTDLLISNNSMSMEIDKSPVDESSVDNMNVIAWNNVIRS